MSAVCLLSVLSVWSSCLGLVLLRLPQVSGEAADYETFSLPYRRRHRITQQLQQRVLEIKYTNTQQMIYRLSLELNHVVLVRLFKQRPYKKLTMRLKTLEVISIKCSKDMQICQQMQRYSEKNWKGFAHYLYWLNTALDCEGFHGFTYDRNQIKIKVEDAQDTEGKKYSHFPSFLYLNLIS